MRSPHDQCRQTACYAGQLRKSHDALFFIVRLPHANHLAVPIDAEAAINKSQKLKSALTNHGHDRTWFPFHAK